MFLRNTFLVFRSLTTGWWHSTEPLARLTDLLLLSPPGTPTTPWRTRASPGTTTGSTGWRSTSELTPSHLTTPCSSRDSSHSVWSGDSVTHSHHWYESYYSTDHLLIISCCRAGSHQVRCSCWMSTVRGTECGDASDTSATSRICWRSVRNMLWSTPRWSTSATLTAPATCTETSKSRVYINLPETELSRIVLLHFNILVPSRGRQITSLGSF